MNAGSYLCFFEESKEDDDKGQCFVLKYLKRSSRERDTDGFPSPTQDTAEPFSGPKSRSSSESKRGRRANGQQCPVVCTNKDLFFSTNILFDCLVRNFMNQHGTAAWPPLFGDLFLG